MPKLTSHKRIFRTAIGLSVWFLVSCSKDKKGCWDCEITMRPGTRVEVCNNSNTAPTTGSDGVGNNYAVSDCRR